MTVQLDTSHFYSHSSLALMSPFRYSINYVGSARAGPRLSFPYQGETVMAVKTADQMVTNWKNAMASPATQAAYTAGINATTSNPMALAAAAADRYAAGT